MNEINEIFDTLNKASNIVHIKDQIEKKRKQLNSLFEHKCGNCDFWMKTNCKPEKEYGKFKSCNSFACKDFHQNNLYGLDKKIENEIKELENKLKKYQIKI